MAAIKEVVVFKLGELAATPSAGVNVTRTILDTKAIVGTLQLNDKGITTASPSIGMCVDKSGNIYLSDYDDQVIVKMTEGGKINHLAGTSGTPGNNAALQNVSGTNALFHDPAGMACDNSGNIYVADRSNNQIRVIKDGKVSVFAGNGAQQAGTVDAAANPLQAKFNNPNDVAVDNSGNVYVADIGSGSIRKIWGAQVLTICGGAVGDLQNVRATKQGGANGFFTNLNSIAVDANGNLFTCDSGNRNIKKITPKGWVYLFSGAGTSGKSLGTGDKPAYTCTYQDIGLVRCDKNGNVYVLDGGAVDGAAYTSRLIKLNTFGVPSNIVEFHEAGSEAAAGLASFAVSPAGKLFVAVIHA